MSESLQVAMARARFARQLPTPPKVIVPAAVRREDESTSVIKALNIRIRDLEDTIRTLMSERCIEAVEPYTPSYKRPTLRQIIRAVSGRFEIEINEIIGERRLAGAVLARQVAMYLCKKLTLNSYPRIGNEFSGRDHTTVMHAYRKIAALRKVDARMDQTVTRLTSELQNGVVRPPDAPSGAVAACRPIALGDGPALLEESP